MPRGGKREGAGRPTKTPGTPAPTVTRAFRVSPETDEGIRQAAEREGVTPTAWLVSVVNQELARAGLLKSDEQSPAPAPEKAEAPRRPSREASSKRSETPAF